MGLQFRLFGIPVRVHPFFFVMAALIGTQGGPGWFERLLIWVVVIFTGVLLHELGHALTGRLFGLQPNIDLYMLGGVTWWKSGSALGPARRMVVSFAGPAVGIAIGLVCLVAWSVAAPPEGGLVEELLQALVFVNLGWGVLNLIPMLPLDGGNLMASFLELFAGDRGRTLARYVSLALAGLIVAAALVFLEGMSRIWIAMLVGILAWNNWRALQAERQLAEDEPLRPDLQAAYDGLMRGDGHQVVNAADRLLARAARPGRRGEAQLLSAWGRFLRGDDAGARAALDAIAADAVPDSMLEAALALHRGDAEDAMRFFEAAMAPTRGRGLEPFLVAAILGTRRFDVAVAVLDAAWARDLAPQTASILSEAAEAAGAGEEGRRLSALAAAPHEA